MKKDLHLEKIIVHIKTKYKCHSIIVYGSQARGDTTKFSDYDVVGISSKQKKLIRIAKKINGVYWDVWIYPENKLKKIDISMINMHQGTVIYDTKAFGKKLLKRIAQFYKKGPEKLLRWEKELKVSWLNKSFARATYKDEEGNVRRYWLLVGLLEDYFLLRRKWYMGSKLSYAWLKKNDKKSYLLFCKVFKNPFDDKNLKRLIQIVTQHS